MLIGALVSVLGRKKRVRVQVCLGDVVSDMRKRLAYVI